MKPLGYLKTEVDESAEMSLVHPVVPSADEIMWDAISDHCIVDQIGCNILPTYVSLGLFHGIPQERHQPLGFVMTPTSSMRVSGS